MPAGFTRDRPFANVVAVGMNNTQRLLLALTLTAGTFAMAAPAQAADDTPSLASQAVTHNTASELFDEVGDAAEDLTGIQLLDLAVLTQP